MKDIKATPLLLFFPDSTSLLRSWHLYSPPAPCGVCGDGVCGQCIAVFPQHSCLLTLFPCSDMGSPRDAVLQGKNSSAWLLHGSQFLQDYLSPPRAAGESLLWRLALLPPPPSLTLVFTGLFVTCCVSPLCLGSNKYTEVFFQINRLILPGHNLVAESVFWSEHFVLSFSRLWGRDKSVWWALHHLKGADSWNWDVHPFREATTFERGTCF